MRKAMIGFMFVIAIAAANADAQVKQSDSNIGIGSVSSGTGNGPGNGTYDVEILIETHKRYGRKLREHGHRESYCRMPDVKAFQCYNLGSSFKDIDGVKLKGKTEHAYSGKIPNLSTSYKIEGSLNHKDGIKWEWPSERDNPYEHQRWTYRDINLLRLRFDNVYWNGWKINSIVRVKWVESDKGNFDDDTEWAYFNAGDMITRCLQGPIGYQTLLPASSNYYWKLDRDRGMWWSDYSIDVYYHVSCTLYPSGPPPPPTCDPVQCSLQCGGGQCTSSGQCVCY